MRHVQGLAASLRCLLLGLPLYATVAGAAATESPPAAEIVTAVWQHHKLTFNYVGFTTLYTCDGLESHVRQILLLLGARKDARVTANGCPGPLDSPSHTAWVDVDFYSPAPAAEGAAPDAPVTAQWTPLELTPRRPSFMGDGDCELVQGMKDLIIHNFSLRDVEYRTDCFPNQVSIDGFAVKGQALRAASAPSPAR